MRAEFSKDIHGTIWFTYAQGIRSRPAHNAMNDNEEKQLRIKQSNDKKREELYQQLQAHLNENKKKNSTLVAEL